MVDLARYQRTPSNDTAIRTYGSYLQCIREMEERILMGLGGLKLMSATYFCNLLQHAASARCFCKLLLHTAFASCFCTLLLQAAFARCFCKLLLPLQQAASATCFSNLLLQGLAPEAS